MVHRDTQQKALDGHFHYEQPSAVYMVPLYVAALPCMKYLHFSDDETETQKDQQPRGEHVL